MKRLLCLLLPLWLLCSGCAPAQPEASDDDGTLHILATTYPVYLFTTAITEGVQGVEVTQLVTGEISCLHDYTLTVSGMKDVEAADVVVMNGAGLESFLTDALAQTSAPVIDCSQGIELLAAAGHEGHDHETEYDPHFWMCRDGAQAMLDNIAQGLSAMDEAHRDAYTENLSQASGLLADGLTEYPAPACPYLITFHDGFQYFARDNGLTLLKAIEEEEGAEASAREIQEIVSLIEEYDLPAIFTEKNGSDATAQAIARETGVEVYQLDMIMSGDGTGIQPYLDAMNANLELISEALS